MDILKAVVEAQPGSTFAQSLLQQYQERGGLSKKQLQGLFNKAEKVKTIPVGKMATLEAIILKKPNRYKSALPVAGPLHQKDETTGQMIDAILAKYPEHKRVLFFKSKYENNEVLTATEMSDLQRFSKLLK
jgi:DNA repair protein RadC